jgi:hypothetical protein
LSVPPSPELRERILEAVRREPVRTRAKGVRARALILAAGFAAPVLLSLVVGGPTSQGRPADYKWVMSATFAVFAGLATWAGVGQGRSMLGRPTSWRTAVATTTPLVLVLVSYCASIVWPETARSHDVPADVVTCLIFTTLFALGPLVAFAVVRRGSDPVAPGPSGAALGAAAGAWGAVGITLHCPHVSLLHIVLGHVVPVATLALVGVLIGHHIVAIRTKTG